MLKNKRSSCEDDGELLTGWRVTWLGWQDVSCIHKGCEIAVGAYSVDRGVKIFELVVMVQQG